MNILYLLFSFTVGGTERLVADICNEMVRRDNNVFLYIVNDLVDEKLVNSLDKKVLVELQRRNSGRQLISTIVKIAKYVDFYNIDVVHCNSFDSPELLLLCKIINPKTKIIYTVHGVNQYKKLNVLRKKYRNLICNNIIGISECVKNDLIENGASKKKTIMVYNGINIHKYQDCVQKKYNECETIIGCIARIMPKVKGQDILLEAANILKEQGYSKFKFIFAGGVSASQEEEYKNLLEYVNDNNLESMVEFVGNINDVPDFMNKIDICVVPSRTEGFGLTLIEAMSMGVPCISVDNEGPGELVRKLNIGDLFEKDNSYSLANQIIKVDSEIKKKKQQAIDYKDKVKNIFSIEEMCNNLEEIYERKY